MRVDRIWKVRTLKRQKEKHEGVIFFQGFRFIERE